MARPLSTLWRHCRRAAAMTAQGHERTSSKEAARSAFRAIANLFLVSRTEQFRASFLWTSGAHEACVVEADGQTDL